MVNQFLIFHYSNLLTEVRACAVKNLRVSNDIAIHHLDGVKDWHVKVAMGGNMPFVPEICTFFVPVITFFFFLLYK